MKTLNEYKKEILIRSEHRIKQHKIRRNAILASCISICLVISTVLLLSRFSVKNGIEPTESADLGSGSSSSGSFVCSYNEVKIVSNESGQFVRLSDRKDVTRIYYMIQEFYRFDLLSDDADGTAEKELENNSNKTSSGAADRKDCYIIAFNADDGTKTIFNLNGTTLLNTTTNETCHLSKSQVEELLKEFERS